MANIFGNKVVLIYFLLSSRASFINGAVIPIDGGQSLSAY